MGAGAQCCMQGQGEQEGCVSSLHILNARHPSMLDKGLVASHIFTAE